MLQTVEAPLHTWEQELYWRDGNPETLIRDGPYVSVVQRLSFLELEAQNHFESRGIVGFAGPCRARTTPVAGSLLWSLLHRGELAHSNCDTTLLSILCTQGSVSSSCGAHRASIEGP